MVRSQRDLYALQKLDQAILEVLNNAFQVNFITVDEAAAYYIKQEKKLKINWKQIDEKVGEDGYAQKAASYNRFTEVIIPRAVPWPEELFEEVRHCALKNCKNLAHNIASNQSDMDEKAFKQQVWQLVLAQMDLESTKLPLKKAQDMVRNETQKFLQTYEQQKQEIQELQQKVMQKSHTRMYCDRLVWQLRKQSGKTIENSQSAADMLQTAKPTAFDNIDNLDSPEQNLFCFTQCTAPSESRMLDCGVLALFEDV